MILKRINRWLLLTILISYCFANNVLDIYHYLSSAEQSIINTTQLAATPQSITALTNLATLGLLQTSQLSDNTSIATFLQDCASNNTSIGTLITASAFANNLPNTFSSLNAIINQTIACLNNPGLTINNTNKSTISTIIMTLITNYAKIIANAYFDTTMYANVWSMIAVPLYTLVNQYCSTFSITSLSTQLTTLENFMSDKTSNYTPQSADLSAFQTNIIVLFSSFRLYAMTNANNIAELYATTLNNTACLLARVNNTNAFVQLDLQGNVITTLALPTTNGATNYGNILKTTLVVANPYLPSGSNIVNNVWYTTANNWLINYLLNSSSFGQSPRTYPVSGVTGTSNITAQYDNGINITLFAAAPSNIFYTSRLYTGSNMGHSTASTLNLTNAIITATNIICSDNLKNYWAACTANNSTNLLYYMSTAYVNLAYGFNTSTNNFYGPQPAVTVALPNQAQGQRVSYLVADTQGYPVIITYPYTYNSTNYPAMIYQLNPSNKSVKNTYNLSSMLTISNPTITPLLAADSNNNYWVCINGNTLVQINTTNNTATRYDLSLILSTIIINNAPLTTITPIALTVDTNNNPWLAFAEAPYLITIANN